MRALRFDRVGDIDALHLAEVPAPGPARGEVRVRVVAAGLNPSDAKNILALYRKGASIVGINSLLYDARACAPVLSRLAAAFDAGALPPPADPVEVDLAAGVEAYRQVNEGPSDKIVLVPGFESP